MTTELTQGMIEDTPLAFYSEDGVDHAVIVKEADITPAPVQFDPVEEAAMKFTKLLPYVKKFGATMSGKGLSRVLHAMAEFPLGATKPRLLNDNERQLFHIMQELQGYKSTVVQEIIKNNALKQTVPEMPKTTE